MVKLRKMTILVALACTVGWVCFAAWTHLSLSADLPSAPDEESGRTHRLVVNHGRVRYGSERDILLLSASENLLPVVACASLVAILWGLATGDFQVRGARHK